MKKLFPLILVFSIFSWNLWANNFSLPPLSYKDLEQTQCKIALTVNDEAITYKDILSRIKLIQFMTDVKPNKEINNKLIPQAIHALIDETIRMQTITSHKIPTVIAPYEETLIAIARDHDKTVSGLKETFKKKHINFSNFERQIIAYRGWNKYTKDQFAMDNTTVSEKEINLKRTKLIRNAGKNQYLLAEILLSPNGYVNDNVLKEEAYKILDALKKGTSFVALAQQFSDGSTAIQGGNLGWIRQGELSAPLDEAIIHLNAGNVSNPIRDGAGYHILYLRDKKQTPQIPATEIILDLLHVWTSYETNDSDYFDAQNLKLEELKRKANSCELLKKIAQKRKDVYFKEETDIVQSRLSTMTQAEIATINDHKSTATLMENKALNFYMVCNRKTTNPSVPSTDQIRFVLSQKKLDTLQRRLFRDAYHAAYIDVRYANHTAS